MIVLVNTTLNGLIAWALYDYLKTGKWQVAVAYALFVLLCESDRITAAIRESRRA